MSHLAHCRRERVIQDKKVIVGIERQLGGIERTRRLPWSFRQLVCESSRNGEESGGNSGVSQELAPRMENGLCFHPLKEFAYVLFRKVFFEVFFEVFSKKINFF